MWNEYFLIYALFHHFSFFSLFFVMKNSWYWQFLIILFFRAGRGCLGVMNFSPIQGFFHDKIKSGPIDDNEKLPYTWNLHYSEKSCNEILPVQRNLHDKKWRFMRNCKIHEVFTTDTNCKEGSHCKRSGAKMPVFDKEAMQRRLSLLKKWCKDDHHCLWTDAFENISWNKQISSTIKNTWKRKGPRKAALIAKIRGLVL